MMGVPRNPLRDGRHVFACNLSGGAIMEITKQISVFLENKPGRLANVLSSLARDKVNLTALTVMDSHEHNVLRFVTDNLTAARRTLNKIGSPAAETDVVLVELRHQPGALAHVCELLAADHINIDYAYCSAGGRNGKTVAILRVTNPEKCTRVLGSSSNHNARRRMGRRPIHTRQGTG
jgi:hypothetical protein